MAKYQILFKASSEKELNQLPIIFINRIIKEIESLSNNPRPNGAKKLKGTSAYRIRISNYRVIYEIDEIGKRVIVFRVRHRKDVYRYL